MLPVVNWLVRNDKERGFVCGHHMQNLPLCGGCFCLVCLHQWNVLWNWFTITKDCWCHWRITVLVIYCFERFIVRKVFVVLSLTHQYSNTVRYFVSVSVEDEGCFRAVSWLQSQFSVIAVNSPTVVYWLTSLHQPCQRKKVWNCFLGSVRASFSPLIGLSSNQPGRDILHMAHSLFCYYHPPPASV